MLRKLEPGLVEMYSRSSVLMTSTMKSEPGRSMTMSPGPGLSFFFFPLSFGGASGLAASGACASTVAAAAPALAAAPFRKVRRSIVDFLSSSIDPSPPRVPRFRITLGFAAGTSFRIQERDRETQQMIDKRVASADAALADVVDGMTLMIGGFGAAG